MKIVIIVLLAFVGAALGGTPWEACDGVSGAITVSNVVVEGCGGNPCQLKKGTNATVAITYKLSKDLAAVYNQVYGIIGGIPIKFPGFPPDQQNACSLGMHCPGKSGDEGTETVKLPVASSDPSIKLIAEWKLTDDEAGKSIQACFKVPLQIVS